MKTFGTIYKITNLVNGKLYVGQTVRSLGERWADHKRDALNGIDFPLYFAIRKYGVDNFIVDPLDSAISLKELNKKEIFWIKELNSLSRNGKGYNVLEGGLGFTNINAEPTINLTTGVKFDSAKEMAEYYGLTYSRTVRCLRGEAKNSNGHIFRYRDDKKQERANVREAFLNSKDNRKNTIICLDTNESFDSIKSASEKLNVSRTSIGNNLNKLSKQAGGLRFAYVESKRA